MWGLRTMKGGESLRSLKIVRRKGKFAIIISADGYNREYEVTNLEAAKNRARKIRTILQIK